MTQHLSEAIGQYLCARDSSQHIHGITVSGCFSVCMPGKNVRNIIRRARHVPGPLAKAAMRIDSLHPLVQEPPFGAVLLRIAAFDLQYEIYATVQPDEKIRPVFTNHTAIDIEHLKAEVI